jgi:UDP-N-acetylglucosamine 2-epimerase (non-hydrolysing)
MAEKILTVVGTRPELIRLSEVIPKLDKAFKHIFVYTGQNYDKQLRDVFFQDLEIREPDYELAGVHGSFGEQLSSLFDQMESILKQEEPSKFLTLGDTNSALSSILAKRMGIPVYHLEAGNRCFDDKVPEEVNRRIIDHSSDVLMPYTERSRMNLIAEGIPAQKTYVIGNPIYEVIMQHYGKMRDSKILSHLNLRPKKYFLVTLHRSENVDNPSRLTAFYNTLKVLASRYKIPLIVSTHPHTRKNLSLLKLIGTEDVRFLEPFGFFDFLRLEHESLCVLTDSGTVQEECAIFKIPNVILRDTTERPETVECGSAILAGAEEYRIIEAIKTVTENQDLRWEPPIGYTDTNVSDKILNIMLSFHYKM